MFDAPLDKEHEATVTLPIGIFLVDLNWSPEEMALVEK